MHPRAVRLATALYCGLLRTLPRRIHERHSTELKVLFEELATEAYARGGRLALFGVWLRGVWDLLASRDVERPAVRRRRWRPPQPARQLEVLLQDVRAASRGLVSSPFTGLVAIGSLAVGMTVTVSVFTFADTILWKAWSYREPDRIVQVFERRDEYQLPSWPTFRSVEEGVDLFEGVLASQLDLFSLGGLEGGARTLAGERVSADYFRVLGVSPERGRYPVGSVDDGGLPVVISHFTWTSVFGSAPDILGREIRLNGYPATIVAVAPEFLDGTKWGVSAELWVPIEAWARHAGWSEWEDDQGLRMTVLARMRRGVDVAAVNAALASLASGMAGAEPAAYAGTRLEATDRLRGDMGPEIGYTSDIIALIAILGGVLVLLVGCGNVASLQLARGVLRARDVAIRHALGASRNRIVRQLLTENLILVLLATVAGVALAALGTEFLVGLLPTFEFRVNFVTRPGTRSLLLAAGLTVVTVVASGLVPALQLSRTDLVSPMKSLGRGGLSRGRARLLGAVVVGMVGASVLALFLAGVFGRALSRNRTVDPGFATSDRIMAVVPLRLAGYGWRDATVLFEELEDRLSELPGVVSVGYGTGIPLGEAWSTAEVLSADREYATGEPGVRAFRSSVSDDYFRAMGTRIIAGRAFRAQDGPQGPWVAMVNEELADRLWPGEDPIGRRIRFGRGEDADPVEVIGLVETGVYYMAGESPEPAVFASFRQWPEAQAMVMLESRGDPLALIPGFRDALAQVDPDVPLQRIRTAESHFDQALWLHRLGSSIGWTVAVFSLLLAAAGLLGVMSFTLGARRHEMGVRRVLGAQSLSVVGVAVRGALRLTVLGLAVGAVLSVVAGQLLRVALTGVEPLDPLLIGGIMLFILFTGTLSGLLPGLSASRVDPVSVLNAEN